MESTSTTQGSVSALKTRAEELYQEISLLRDNDYELTDDKSLYELEIHLHKLAKELADTVTGIKLQEHLAQTTTVEEEKKNS